MGPQMHDKTLKTIANTATADLIAFAAKLASVESPSEIQVQMWAAVKREITSREVAA